MKIDVYTDTYKPEINGVVTQICVLRKKLKKAGHKVKIFAPHVPKYEDHEKDIYRLQSVRLLKTMEEQMAGRMALPLPTKPFRASLISKPDLIHVHGPGTLGFLAFLTAKSRKCPSVLTFHAMITEYAHYIGSTKVVKPWMMKRYAAAYCKMADWIIAPSPKIEKELRAWGVRRPISVISNGVEVPLFSGDKNYLYKRGFVEKSDKVLLYVGRVAKEKNLEFLVKIFPKIYQKDPKTKLVIVGDGPHLKNIKKLTKHKAIVFTGIIPHEDVLNANASGDVFVFASKTEVQPFSILEALAAGLPIVALQDAALEGLVNDGYNGYQVQNEQQFKQRIIELLDKKVAKKFGKNSKKIAQLHSAQTTFIKHFEIYKKVIDNHKRGTIGDYEVKREKSILGKIFPGAFASLAIIALIGVFFAFNMPTEIKAAPGIIKDNAKELAVKGAQKIKTQINRVEETVKDIKN